MPNSNRPEESAPHGEIRTYTEDERREHTERLAAMIEDDGDTWDLSDNDKAALRFAHQAVTLAGLAVCAYCGHIGPKTSAAMSEHAVSCDKRPEMTLFNLMDAIKAYAAHKPECSQSKPWYQGRPLHHCTCGLAKLVGLESAQALQDDPVEPTKEQTK